MTEMAFWKPDPADPSRIVRAARTPDDPAGISEFPHLIVNQARVLDYFAEFMANAPTRMRPDYGYEFAGLEVADERRVPGHRDAASSTAGDRRGPGAHRARQVRGGRGRRPQQGARGDRLHTSPATRPTTPGASWTCSPSPTSPTSAPSARSSPDGGSILLIPREGGYLFRMYVDLGEVDPDDHHAVRRPRSSRSSRKANEILHPYTLDVRNVAWHSVYEVGHRLTDRFDDVPPEERGTRTPRVFIAGDACHTHSAKAGQGMNVSMQDGWNIGWKLGHVLEGRSPESLLATYSAERQVVAQEPHRLRQGVVDDDGEEARGVRRPRRSSRSSTCRPPSSRPAS